MTPRYVENAIRTCEMLKEMRISGKIGDRTEISIPNFFDTQNSINTSGSDLDN
jgi:hypothetical protein